MKYLILLSLIVISSCAITTPGKIADLEIEAERNERLYRDCVEAVENSAVEVRYDSLVIIGTPVEIIDSDSSEGQIRTVYRTTTRIDTIRVVKNETKVVKVPDPTIKNENDLLRAELENASSSGFKDSILFGILGLVIGIVLMAVISKR